MPTVDLSSEEWRDRSLDLFTVVCSFIPSSNSIREAFEQLANTLGFEPNEQSIRSFSKKLRTDIEWTPTVRDHQSEKELQNHLAAIKTRLDALATFLDNTTLVLKNLCIDPDNKDLIGFNYDSKICVYDRRNVVLYSTTDTGIDLISFLGDPISSSDTLKITYLDNTVVTRNGKNSPFEFRTGDQFSIESIKTYISQIGKGDCISGKGYLRGTLKEITLQEPDAPSNIVFEYADQDRPVLEIQYGGPLKFIPQNKIFEFDFENGSLRIRQEVPASTKTLLELDNSKLLADLINDANKERFFARLNLLKIAFHGQDKLRPKPLPKLFEALEISDTPDSVEDYFWRLNHLLQSDGSNASETNRAKWRLDLARISSFFDDLKKQGWQFGEAPNNNFVKVEGADNASALFDPDRGVVYIWPEARRFPSEVDFTRPLEIPGEIYVVNNKGLSLRRLQARDGTDLAFHFIGEGEVKIGKIKQFILQGVEKSASDALLAATFPEVAKVKSAYFQLGFLKLELDIGSKDVTLEYYGPVRFNPGDEEIEFDCNMADIAIYHASPATHSKQKHYRTVFISKGLKNLPDVL